MTLGKDEPPSLSGSVLEWDKMELKRWGRSLNPGWEVPGQHV